MQNNKKTAIVLFNLGGPDSLNSVKGFLFNLFYDPNIIRLPNPIRWIIAKFISARREEKSKKIYAQMGNKSTILPITQIQALKLEEKLHLDVFKECKVFISMKYWNPFASEIIKKIELYNPEEIILFPLYPQFSTTTTKSSFEEFCLLLSKSKLKSVVKKAICCYFKDSKFIDAHVSLIKSKILDSNDKYRIIFSAHSLPEKIIKSGDPYQDQIEQTCHEIVKKLKIEKLDFIIAYQSKVGPLKWLSPSTEDEIIKAAKDKVDLIVVPIAFVSEHSETLVELDIDYKNLFESMSSNKYLRVPALNKSEDLIESISQSIKKMAITESDIKKMDTFIFSENKCNLDKFKGCYCNLRS